MSHQPNKKRIGLFLIIGFACLFGIIGKFVIERVMPQNDRLLVMFFDESVKGLNVGSSVVLEGVEVGKVARISLIADLSKNDDFRIPVFVRMANNLNVGDIQFRTQAERREVLQKLVERGLRARLATQNFLTGQLMIELVMMPNTPVQYVILPETAHIPQIPTTLSTIGELSKGFQDLPLRDIVFKLDKVMDTMNAELPVILPRYAQLGENLNELSVNLTKLTDTLDKTVNRLDKNVPKTSETLNHFNQTLNTIERAANSMRNLTDYLERHPESLLRGKGK